VPGDPEDDPDKKDAGNVMPEPGNDKDEEQGSDYCTGFGKRCQRFNFANELQKKFIDRPHFPF